MTSLPFDTEEIKSLIKAHVENFPDIDALIAEGKLKRSAGWYMPSDKATYDAIAPYATSFLISPDKKPRLKIRKPTVRLKTAAAKL